MSKATPARLLALEVTRQIREREAYAHKLIESRVRGAEMPPFERDFATLLILGVTATSGELDYLIDRALTHGIVKPDVRDALRVSVYELFFLRREVHVAVDQGVELVRSFAPHASGFANKVLREITKMREAFPFGDPTNDVEALAHQQAFPLWLARRLIADLGFESAAEFMAASNTRAPLFLADLSQGMTLEIAPSELSTWLPRIEAGELIVADASAQQVAALAVGGRGKRPTNPSGTLAPSPSPGSSPFLEVGSGRGTKTVLLQYNALRASGRQPALFALDLHAFKQDILKERIRQYRLENVTPLVGDVTQLDEIIARGELPESFGGALIDAPCSGTGTLRRHPEIRWRLTPEEVTAMAAQGLRMLRAVARHIEPGGFVVYSTCSVLCEENEQVVEAFLACEDGGSFALAPPGAVPNPFSSKLTPNSPDAHFAVKLTKHSTLTCPVSFSSGTIESC